MKSNRRRREFAAYLRLFLLLAMAVIVLTGGVQYACSYQILEKEAQENGKSALLLENSHEMILDQVDESVQGLLNNSMLFEYMDYFRKGKHNICLSIIEQLRAAVANNGYLHSICVFFCEDNYTLSSDFGPSELRWYPDAAFAGALELEAWPYNQYGSRALETGQPVITFVRTVPVFSATRSYKAYVIVNLDVEAINRSLRLLSFQDDLRLLVLDEYGHLLAGLAPSQGAMEALSALRPSAEGWADYARLDGVSSVVYSLRSARGWNYYMARPKAAVMGGISRMRNGMLMVCACAFGMSVALSMLLSRRAYEPLRRIADRLEQARETPDGARRESEHILRQIDCIMARNAQLETACREMAESRREASAAAYPAEMENRLLRALKNRDKKAVRQCLDALMLHLVKSGAGESAALACYRQLQGVVGQLQSRQEEAQAFSSLAQADEALERQCGQVIESLTALPAAPPSELIQRVCEYIDAHLNEDLRLEALEEKFYISESNLRKRFRAEMGMTLKEYADGRRMVEARRMLLDKKLQIQEIARCLGFEYPQSFIRFFRSIEGVSPGDYREQNSPPNA